MGQHADDIINGECCEMCSSYFVDKKGEIAEHGYPAVCDDCWKDLSPNEKCEHNRAKYKTL